MIVFNETFQSRVDHELVIIKSFQIHSILLAIKLGSQISKLIITLTVLGYMYP